MFDSSKIVEFLRLSNKQVAIVAVATGCLLFIPQQIAEKLGLYSTLQSVRPWIGFAFVIACSFLAVSVVAECLAYAKKRWIWHRNLIRYQKRLHDLTPEEKDVLREYIANDTRTIYRDIQDGVIRGLEAESIVARTSTVAVRFTTFPFNIQPWAWDYLRQNPQLIDLQDVSSHTSS